MVAGVDAGLDLALAVELQQLPHGADDQLLIGDVAQVEAADALVGLHQFEHAERQLVVPGLRHGQQVLLLARHTIGRAWKAKQLNRVNYKSERLISIYL